MAILHFQTVLMYGDDRGSVWPVRTYQVALPPAKHKAYLDALGAAYQQVMENVVGEQSEYQGFWVEDLTTYLDETEQMLRRDRYVANGGSPDQVTGAAAKVAAQLIKDTLTSKAFGDTFWLDDDSLAEKSLEELLTASKKQRAQPEVVTERIALGTMCYHVDPSLPRGVQAAAVFTGPSKYSPEESFVPVAEVEAETAAIEAFPLPLALSKHNRWFARVKDHKRIEALAVKRADAIALAKIKAAHRRYWAQA